MAPRRARAASPRGRRRGSTRLIPAPVNRDSLDTSLILTVALRSGRIDRDATRSFVPDGLAPLGSPGRAGAPPELGVASRLAARRRIRQRDVLLPSGRSQGL